MDIKQIGGTAVKKKLSFLNWFQIKHKRIIEICKKVWWVLCKFRFSLLFLFFAAGCFYTGAYMHELVHQRIFISYGIDSYIQMGWNAAWTIPYNASLAIDLCNDYCQLAHNINEAVGYQLQYFWMMIFAGLQFIILMKERKAIFEELEKT